MKYLLLLQIFAADAAAVDRKYYVVVSLLADPKNSQSMCIPQPTTFTSHAGPSVTSGGGGVDLESPYLFSLLDQEEETHIVQSSSSSPSFDRYRRNCQQALVMLLFFLQ